MANRWFTNMIKSEIKIITAMVHKSKCFVFVFVSVADFKIRWKYCQYVKAFGIDCYITTNKVVRLIHLIKWPYLARHHCQSLPKYYSPYASLKSGTATTDLPHARPCRHTPPTSKVLQPKLTESKQKFHRPLAGQAMPPQAFYKQVLPSCTSLLAANQCSHSLRGA